MLYNGGNSPNVQSQLLITKYQNITNQRHDNKVPRITERKEVKHTKHVNKMDNSNMHARPDGWPGAAEWRQVLYMSNGQNANEEPANSTHKRAGEGKLHTA